MENVPTAGQPRSMSAPSHFMILLWSKPNQVCFQLNVIYVWDAAPWRCMQQNDLQSYLERASRLSMRFLKATTGRKLCNYKTEQKRSRVGWSTAPTAIAEPYRSLRSGTVSPKPKVRVHKLSGLSNTDLEHLKVCFAKGIAGLSVIRSTMNSLRNMAKEFENFVLPILGGNE